MIKAKLKELNSRIDLVLQAQLVDLNAGQLSLLEEIKALSSRATGYLITGELPPLTQASRGPSPLPIQLQTRCGQEVDELSVALRQ